MSVPLWFVGLVLVLAAIGGLSSVLLLAVMAAAAYRLYKNL